MEEREGYRHGIPGGVRKVPNALRKDARNVCVVERVESIDGFIRRQGSMSKGELLGHLLI